MIAVCRKGKIAKSAMLLSCALHIALLGILAIVDFSASPSQALAVSLPSISVKDIKAVTNLAQIMPKPKVAPPKKPESLQTDVSTLPKAIARNHLTSGNSANVTLSSASQVTFNKTEFFSSATDVRKICFVVDRSASMLGTFNRVRTKLKNTARAQQRNSYIFYVLIISHPNISLNIN